MPPSPPPNEPSTSTGGCCCGRMFSKIWTWMTPSSSQSAQQSSSSAHRSSRILSSGGGGGIATTASSGQHPGSRRRMAPPSGAGGYPNGAFHGDEDKEEQAMRLRRLEEMVYDIHGKLEDSTSAHGTPLSAPKNTHGPPSARFHPTPDDTAASLRNEIDRKDALIARLKAEGDISAGNLSKMEQDYAKLRTDNQELFGDLTRMKNKLSDMERDMVASDRRLEEIKTAKASGSDDSYMAVQLQDAEREIIKLKRELSAAHSERSKQLQKKQEEIDFLELTNKSLDERLVKSEDEKKKLESDLVAVRLEQSTYQQSCSSGSTPLADEETRSAGEVGARTSQSVGDRAASSSSSDHQKDKGAGDAASTGRVARYTKAHSTLGAGGLAITPVAASSASRTGSSPFSITPRSRGNNLIKSLSNYNLSGAKAKGGAEELPEAVSQLVRKSFRTVYACRQLSSGLRESAVATINGEQPDTRALFCTKDYLGDSTSESEDDKAVVAVDCSRMGVSEAEKTMRRQDTHLQIVYEDLEAMRKSLLGIYQQRFVDDVEQKGDCRVQ